MTGPAADDAPLFDDGKDAAALRTIGEVATALGIRQHVLRYWEEQFPTLRPVKRSGSRRYYRPEDVALVRLIDRLVHREGYTLRGARSHLARGGAGDAPAASAPAVTPPSAEAPAAIGAATNAAMVAQLRAIRATLAGALAAS